ncbi:MAG: aminoglycoside phosphotransferase [Humibacillus sp.]|nr:aminoglycoside phosphotransferase [Humibacillus sp.]
MPEQVQPVRVADVAALSAAQVELLDAWLPGAVVTRDHGWGLVATTVLEVEHDGHLAIVKAGGASDHHIEREVRAHREWLPPWVDCGDAPRLLHADPAAKVLVTRYLPGRLVLGDPAADEPETYRQAGTLLAQLHGQHEQLDVDHEHRENAKALAWLDGDHRIDAATAHRLRALISSWPHEPATVVPTHGDWQPRNWLVDDGTVRVIDFGRAALRPALTDLTRLAAQDFARDPALEAAFLDGYGSDPREPAAWLRTRVREAIGTACWAHAVGDTGFEAQGHRMVAEVLAVV